jgi:hypothetical protein
LVIVDATSRIVYANACAHNMIKEANVMRASMGSLVDCDHGAAQVLADVFKNAKDGDIAVGRKGIAIPLTARNGEHYVGHVLPLTSGARRKAGVSYSATAAIFIRKAALDTVFPFESVAQRFHLTAAETRVLFAVVEIGGVPEIAPILGSRSRL